MDLKKIIINSGTNEARSELPQTAVQERCHFLNQFSLQLHETQAVLRQSILWEFYHF